MFRAAPRLIARAPVLPRLAAPTRRGISTAPPTKKSRSWKSLAARIGIAGTILYYYNTTDVFAEEPEHSRPVPPAEHGSESDDLPTIESLTAEREKRKAVQAKLDEQRQKQALSTHEPPEGQEENAGGMGGLEQEADQQGAFNPETGEINWDCPCLGGMADGPCGEQFKAAFSCFVYSTEEPKGMDCIDRFKDMQNCFREYPEVYGSELEGAEEDEEEERRAYAEDAAAQKPESQTSRPAPESAKSAQSEQAPSSKPAAPTDSKQSVQREPPSNMSIAEDTPADKANDRPSLGLVPKEYKPEGEERK